MSDGRRRAGTYEFGSHVVWVDFDELLKVETFEIDTNTDEALKLEPFEVGKAFEHELGHYTQDLFTSFGAHHFHGARNAVKATRAALPTKPAQWTQDMLKPLTGLCTSRALMNLPVTFELHRRKAKQPVSWTFTTKEILEADAMASVHELLSRMVVEGELSNLSSRNRARLADDINARGYGLAYRATRSLVQTVAGLSDEELYTHVKIGEHHVALGHGIHRLMVDYSLSVPFMTDPSWYAECVPAHRFAAVASAIHRMSAEDLADLVGQSMMRPEKAFDTLDGKCSFRHSSTASAHGWLDWMTALYEDTSDPLAWIRMNAMRYRIENYHVYMHRDPTCLIREAGIPFFMFDTPPDRLVSFWPAGCQQDRAATEAKVAWWDQLLRMSVHAASVTELDSAIGLVVSNMYNCSFAQQPKSDSLG